MVSTPYTSDSARTQELYAPPDTFPTDTLNTSTMHRNRVATLNHVRISVSTWYRNWTMSAAVRPMLWLDLRNIP